MRKNGESEIVSPPVRGYWLKVAGCCAFFLLFAADELGGNWYSSFAPPWLGIIELGRVFIRAVSPLPLIYLVILVTRK